MDKRDEVENHKVAEINNIYYQLNLPRTMLSKEELIK